MMGNVQDRCGRSAHAQGWQSTKDPLACASPDSIMATAGQVEPKEIEAFSLSSRFTSERQPLRDPRPSDDTFTEQLTASLDRASVAEAQAPARFLVLPSATRHAVSQQPQLRSGACRAGSASVDHSWSLEAMVSMMERTSSWSHGGEGVDLEVLDILESMQDDDGTWGCDPSASILPTLGVSHGMLPVTLEDERANALAF